MKKLIAFSILISLGCSANAQFGLPAKTPEFMQKILTCKINPEAEICQEKNPTKTDVPAVAGNANNSSAPRTSEAIVGTFNLKGLSLLTRKADISKILPRATAHKSGSYDGKIIESFICGKHVEDSKSSCNFTFGGVEILDVVIDYWGDDVTQIQLFFNDYTQVDKGAFYESTKNIQDGLDAKYKQYANPEPRLGKRDAGDGVWSTKSEILQFDRDKIHTDKLESLVLTNIPLRKKLSQAVGERMEKDEETANKKRVSKSKADM